MVYRHVFRRSVKGYWLRNYACMGLFVIALFLLNGLETDQLISNGLISLGISAAVLGVAVVADRVCFRRMAGGELRGKTSNER